MMSIKKAFEKTEFLFGPQASYIESLYKMYLMGDVALPDSWKIFFLEIDPNKEGYLSTPSTFKEKNSYFLERQEGVSREVLDSIRALMLIRAYRVRGHLYANLDPLKLKEKKEFTELEPKKYGFREKDRDRNIYIDNVLGRKEVTMREILQMLKEIYSGTVGVEFMHIQDGGQKSWIQDKVENLVYRKLSASSRMSILDNLMRAEFFEKFLNIKYPGTKRFGLDGGESFIPCLNTIIERSSGLGVKSIVLGMAHRGRLNVLANTLEKPLESIFNKFQSNASHLASTYGDGDVKYHIGGSSTRYIAGKKIHLSLISNPSHLEAVNPVVLGRVRAEQDAQNDTSRLQVMGILIHGDAAFSGQGLVAESLDLSQLKGYKTGGTIHVIINNQIGFTTSPIHSRSSPYCSDLAKTIQAPIFHVNGDDPEAVSYVASLAAEFRHKFSKDIVIDMYCYRRHGHNEGDEPMFTQPLMYKAIKNHPTVYSLYREKLIKEGVVILEDTEKNENSYKAVLSKKFELSVVYKKKIIKGLKGRWKKIEFYNNEENQSLGKTGVPLKILKEIGNNLVKLPKDFMPHSKIQRFLQTRKKRIDSGKAIDWSTAEALAFGTLLAEKNSIRFSGQDSGRGTFSQRHAVLYDQENNNPYISLQHIKKEQGSFEIVDSPLAEASILGFEYGYSIVDPQTLVLWEAQFGDFSNGAQVIIDQFLSSGESKWMRMGGLVLLLPHGYEGQGAEHSSARIERYLQLCAEENMQVVNCTTPANYFHVLRRQLHRCFRKPLIVFTPKSLLRSKVCISDLIDFGTNKQMQLIIDETSEFINPGKVKRIIFCSGKIYYDLLEERRERDLNTVALIRIEQLYPFPEECMQTVLKKYNREATVIWSQEEPQNMGAWYFMDRRIENVLASLKFSNPRPSFVGRKGAAATATSMLKKHLMEQRKIVQQTLTGVLDNYMKI